MLVVFMSKTSLGLEENIEGLLCYLLGVITGIIFLVLEKESDFVKFHAMQSIVTFLSLFILSMVVAVIPFVGVLISLLVNLISLAFWILGMYKAYQGEKYKFPIFGDISEDLLKKINI
ncbi:MAG TPA: DUF4870 domain-containing protein [Methanothermococcus okinawensis]|uniref:DUF4870 domain-containing protein n=1 Tax=Methanothermococcus okinawensis TaxID=155863 RepID=A0A832YSK3_9EURY|nr:DUF4870 domain-containing protein [Methanothermococcus okinawensis]